MANTNKKKVLTKQQTDDIVAKLKANWSINRVRKDTNLGVNILKRILKENNIPYTTTQGHKGRVTERFKDIFIEKSTASNCALRRCIMDHDLIPHDKCYNCGLSEWVQGPLILDLDHINGNNRDNRLDNLQFLCPNCHSQTHSYKGRNINTGRKKVPDIELINALKTERCIHAALIKVGLTPKGGNYERAYKLQNVIALEKSNSDVKISV